MPYPVVIRRPREITPPEALDIADQLREAADALASLVADLYQSKNDMEMTWQGRAKNRFDDAAGSPERRLEYLVEDLRRMAHQVGSIEVTIWEEETIYVSERDPPILD